MVICLISMVILGISNLDRVSMLGDAKANYFVGSASEEIVEPGSFTVFQSFVTSLRLPDQREKGFPEVVLVQDDIDPSGLIQNIRQ